MPELWARAPDATSRKLRELYAQDGTGVNRKLKELWANDGTGVSRKIFSGYDCRAKGPITADGHITPGEFTSKFASIYLEFDAPIIYTPSNYIILKECTAERFYNITLYDVDTQNYIGFQRQDGNWNLTWVDVYFNTSGSVRRREIFFNKSDNEYSGYFTANGIGLNGNLFTNIELI